MAYSPQINQFRSLEYRANLLMGQGRFKEAGKLLEELLPLYDQLVQTGNDPKRLVGKDRKHYEILKFQCGEKGRQSEVQAQDWIKEIDIHLTTARALIKTDLRSAAGTVLRVQDMVQKKEAPTDIKNDLMKRAQALAEEVKAEALAVAEEARNALFINAPAACTRYEIAIDVLKRFGMNVKAQQFEEELGTAVYVSQTGSRLQDVQDRLKRADKAEDIARLEAEMERLKSDVSSAQGGTQGGQMQAYLSKILSEVEATRRAASEQKQIIVAQNVRIGDEINIKDSVVQRSQIGGGGASGPVIAGEARSGSNINVDGSVVVRSDLGGNQDIRTDASLKQTSTGQPKAFSACPYCGEKFNLPKTPKFCPYCSEQLVQ